MVTRFDQNNAHAVDAFNGNNPPDISAAVRSRRSPSNDNFTGDDLIRSLSDAYENKRARQVFEWESTRLRGTSGTLL
ncbi:MAG: hypothetical protein ACR2IH_12350 [Pyrinomonadaceae bacterium]